MKTPDENVRKDIWKLFLKKFKSKYNFKKLSSFFLTGGDVKNIMLEYLRYVAKMEKEAPSELVKMVEVYTREKGIFSDEKVSLNI